MTRDERTRWLVDAGFKRAKPLGKGYVFSAPYAREAQNDGKPEAPATFFALMPGSHAAARQRRSSSPSTSRTSTPRIKGHRGINPLIAAYGRCLLESLGP
jgi:hypothetical protein